MKQDFRAEFFPDNYYHIFNHAVGSEKLFIQSDNYLYFLGKISQYLFPIADIYAYSLLPQHFHLFLSIKNADALQKEMERLQYPKRKEENIYPVFLLQQFSNMFNAYTKALNKQQLRKGKLFIEPFNRKLISTQADFIKVVKYVHFNPVKHGYCKKVEDYPYSSYIKF